jgi:hypothetical protein
MEPRQIVATDFETCQWQELPVKFVRFRQALPTPRDKLHYLTARTEGVNVFSR